MLQNNNIKATTHVCPQYAALAENPKRNPTAAAILSALPILSKCECNNSSKHHLKKSHQHIILLRYDGIR